MFTTVFTALLLAPQFAQSAPPAAPSGLELPVLGRTWIVDDDGGAGVDFTTIQAAISAAVPNDVVVVRTGTYAAVVLSKAMRIVADGTPRVPSVTISATPAQSLAVVSGLRGLVANSSIGVTVRDCAGTVVVDDVRSWSVEVSDASDVRLRQVALAGSPSSLEILRSRVEVVDCAFDARDGPDVMCQNGPYPHGYTAARVQQGTLHAARSTFVGGDGGDTWCGDTGQYEPGGDGGSGIVAYPSSRVLLTGAPSNQIAWGRAGTGPECCSYDGVSLLVGPDSSARVSGVSLVGTVVSWGPIEYPPQRDPTLALLDRPAPGSNATFRLFAPAGSSARVAIGAVPVVVADPGIAEDRLVTGTRTVDLGTVPAEGVLGWNYALPSTWPAGTTVFVQATVTYPGGEQRRTHSIPIIVR